MEVIECIKTRRSIRKFKDKEIEKDKLKLILESAKYAPSAGNLQAREFIIIKDKKTKEKISEAAYSQNFISGAQILIAACADKSKSQRYKEKAEIYSICDCCASIENIILSGNSLGIGSCWIGAFDEKKVKEILGIPENIKIVALLPMGYAAENPEAPDRELSLHFEKW